MRETHINLLTVSRALRVRCNCGIFIPLDDWTTDIEPGLERMIYEVVSGPINTSNVMLPMSGQGRGAQLVSFFTLSLPTRQIGENEIYLSTLIDSGPADWNTR